MLELSDLNFEKEAIEASKIKPVLVDFYATWCGSCKMMAPIFEEVAAEIGDKAIFAKANAEEASAAAEKYEVMTLPVFALFKNGKMEKSIFGPQPKEALVDLLK
jgi:thioredoxin 1